MTYDEESRIAQDVLDALAARQLAAYPGLFSGRPLPRDVKLAGVDLGGEGYSVHRHGHDLWFHQQTGRWPGRSAIVSVLGHQGGWILASVTRPAGEHEYDDRVAEAARGWVQQVLASLGHRVGTAGREGRELSAKDLERDIDQILGTQGRPPRASGRRTR